MSLSRLLILVTLLIPTEAGWDDFEFIRENNQISNLKVLPFPTLGDYELAPTTVNLASKKCK